MAKDYAKYTSIKRLPKKNRPNLFLIIFAIIFLGLVGYSIYKYKSQLGTQDSGVKTFFANIKSHFHKQPKEIQPVVKPQTAAKAEQAVHFDFYNELPNMKVKMSDAENSKSATPPPAQTVKSPSKTPAPMPVQEVKKEAYIVHIAELKDENEASQMRISLLLSGIDANVVKIGATYHIQQGPFTSLGQAKAVQKKLEKKGIESTVSNS